MILIAGANQGIGYHFVKQLLEDGNFVSVLDIEVNHLINLKKTIFQSIVVYIG
ncbi:hypothetical protein [Floccifex sp.]|uniref:hypothetical protein n=1 Tax=Floccifex sp. TaxID=2815810 RepID=UPI003F051601